MGSAEGQGKPMIWTGGPYLRGQRGVVFTDGSYQSMSEREFRELNAVAQPLPQWLTDALDKLPAS